jgi:hypothetical protein
MWTSLGAGIILPATNGSVNYYKVIYIFYCFLS